MPKPFLKEPLAQQERDMFDTMTAGLHEWRPDLNYPESYSDFQACIRGLLRMYKVERRPMAIELEYADTREESDG